MASFKVGDRVVQSNYGAGTITGADDHHTVIDFDEHGVKTFATGLVVLERTAAPAPQKGTKTRRAAKSGTAAAKAGAVAAKTSAATSKASAKA